MNDRISGLFKSFPARLVLILLIGLPVLALLGDWAYAPIASSGCAANAKKIASEFEGADLPAEEVLRLVNKYGLAWLYVTDKDSKLQPAYKASAPDLPAIKPNSRLLLWHNQRYFETVASEGNRAVHAGYLMEPLWSLSRGISVPAGFILYLLCSSTVLSLVAYYFFVVVPIRRLPQLVREAVNAQTSKASGLDGPWVSSEIAELDKQLREVGATARSEALKEIAAAKNDVADLLARGAQDKFLTRLMQDIQSVQSSDRICDLVLHRVYDEYPGLVRYGLSYRMNNNVLILNGQLGLTTDEQRALVALPDCAAIREAISKHENIVQRGAIADINVPGADKITTSLVAPLFRGDKAFGAFIFFLNADEKLLMKPQLTIRNAATATSNLLLHVVACEEALEANRRDELTGMHNRKYLAQYSTRLNEERLTGERVSVLLIEGDGFMMLNEKHGRQAGDQLIKELAGIVADSMPPHNTLPGSLPSIVFRYSAAQFLMVLRDCISQRANLIAEKLRTCVDQHPSWPGAIPTWSVSIGVATCPEESGNIGQLIADAETANAYLKEQKKSNEVLSISKVPKTYRVRRQGSTLGGNLDMFDPAGLLRSMAATKKTGLLEVSDPNKNRLVVYFLEGKATKAKLKRLGGHNAIIEYIATFDDGTFSFKEVSGDSSGGEELTRLGKEYDLTQPLEDTISSALIALEDLEAAKAAIPKAGLFVSRIPGSEKRTTWEELKALPNRPSDQEIGAMEEIFKLGVGVLTLREIFAKLDHIPTPLLWKAASLLVSHQFIKLSSIRVFANS